MKIDIKEVGKFFVLLALSVFVFYIAGWMIGATIGGNLASEEYVCKTEIDGSELCETISDFTYRDLPGYEGTGLLGSHIGLVAGFVVAVIIYRKFEIIVRRKQKATLVN